MNEEMASITSKTTPAAKGTAGAPVGASINGDEGFPKLLIIVDYNGSILLRTEESKLHLLSGNRHEISRRCRSKYVVPRTNMAFFLDNLQDLAKRSEGAVQLAMWTSMMGHNRTFTEDFIFSKCKGGQRWLFRWDRNHTEPDPEGEEEWSTIKPLRKVWKAFPQFDRSNTVIIDDVLSKFKADLPNLIHVPSCKDEAGPCFGGYMDGVLRELWAYIHDELLPGLREGMTVPEILRARPIRFSIRGEKMLPPRVPRGVVEKENVEPGEGQQAVRTEEAGKEHPAAAVLDEKKAGGDDAVRTTTTTASASALTLHDSADEEDEAEADALAHLIAAQLVVGESSDDSSDEDGALVCLGPRDDNVVKSDVGDKEGEHEERKVQRDPVAELDELLAKATIAEGEEKEEAEEEKDEKEGKGTKPTK